MTTPDSAVELAIDGTSARVGERKDAMSLVRSETIVVAAQLGDDALAAVETSCVATSCGAAPLEGMVVDEFAGHRVMAVAFGFGTERADHL